MVRHRTQQPARRTECALPKLRLEPGRALSGPAGVAVGKVGAIKTGTSKKWVNLDISTNHLSWAAVLDWYYHSVPVKNAGAEPTETVDLVGPLCNSDEIGPHRNMPVLSRGDFVAFLDAGGYTESSAARYNAQVMVDDSHAIGFVGRTGRGSAEHTGGQDKIDLFTGTFGKALGGASGGYIAGKKPVIDLLRQRSRPYLFSNSLMPAIVAATSACLQLIDSAEGADLRAQLAKNGRHFREQMSKLGFKLVPGEHPIIPVMLGDAKLASAMADALLKEGIYVIGFSYPVVPKGQARIRTQMSAAHSIADIDRVIAAFAKVGKELGAI